MLGVASGAILVPLNSTMLAVALPGIMDEFGLGANEVSSVVTLYLGAVAVALPVSGSLGDRFGHRLTFIAGVLAFGAASLLAAISTSFAVLELARVLQAVSGAFVSTGSASIIRDIAPAGRRGEAFGLFDLLVSVSAAVGPFVGGVLVGAFGWRSMFYLAVPIAIAAAAAVAFLLPAASRPRRPAPGPAARHPGPGRPRRAHRRVPGRAPQPGRPTSASAPRSRRSSCCPRSSRSSCAPSTRPSTRACSGRARSRPRSPACSGRRSCSTARSCSCRCSSNGCWGRRRRPAASCCSGSRA